MGQAGVRYGKLPLARASAVFLVPIYCPYVDIVQRLQLVYVVLLC